MAIKSYMMIACLLVTAGCTVGPNYHRPSVDLQGKWMAPENGISSTAAISGVPTSRPSMVQPGGALPEQWWTTLDDPTLNGLVDRAVRSNLDLRSAAARVREARADWAGARAGLFSTARSRRNRQGGRFSRVRGYIMCVDLIVDGGMTAV
jgi:outer membrane protein, multidrug efflux system